MTEKQANSQAVALLDALKRHLKSKGMTYKTLAERCELTETTIKRLLNRPHIPLDQLMQLCQAAETNMNDLLLAAETDLASQVTSMSHDQADAILNQPALISVLGEVQLGLRSVSAIAEHFKINRASAYLYVRKLEELGCFDLDGDIIKLKFPLQSSLTPRLHQETVDMIMENILDGVRQFVHAPHEDVEPDTGLIHGDIMLLSDEDYRDYYSEIRKIIEHYQNISLSNVKHPSPKNKPREQLLVVMPKRIASYFEVPNLVDEVEGVAGSDTNQ
jgi:DNA-binding Xre family transcriptional regulator/AcrR family transcriptional regulator